ncbi:MAG: DUF5131 family protein [Deferribacteres bacterium]|nr:DUF5131 family protein [Deferribacteres bacterium]
MFDRIEKGLWWDRAWTLVEGCTKVSPACRNCWAERDAWRKSHQKNEKISRRYEDLLDENGHWTGRIRLMENFDIPCLIKKIRRPTVFAIWNDLFHENVPRLYIEHALIVMALLKKHVFLVLTKRIDRAKKILDTPAPNIWFGVTAENQEQANRRIPTLMQIRAAKRFVSIEPMLGPVILEKWLADRKLDWVILGGETGKNARPMHPGWARKVRDDCQAAGVPFFFKQWGEWLPDRQLFNHPQGPGGKLMLTLEHNSPKAIATRQKLQITTICHHGFTTTFAHVGKKAAGALLDGREWREVPE